MLGTVLPPEFGRPSRAQIDGAHARFSEMPSQTPPPRGRCRLKEQLEDDGCVAVELVVERANPSARRVGVFLSGNLAQAATSGELRRRPTAQSARLPFGAHGHTRAWAARS